MKAYKVTIKDWDVQVIVAASTRGAAMAQQQRQVNDAGWVTRFTDIRAVRAVEFDNSVKGSEKRAYTLGWSDNYQSWGCLAQ